MSAHDDDAGAPPPATRPTVIVPAHNEAGTIGSSLTALLSGEGSDAFDVVVVCNGCVDDTASEAREAATRLGRDIRVLTTPTASKTAAIRLGEAVAGHPRLYLDADVTCPTSSALALFAALGPGVDLAVPRRVLDTRGATRAAAAYHRGWSALPWVEAQLAGRGAYAVSPRLRATFEAFPDTVADDRFVTTRVGADRAVVVDGAPVVVRPARRLRDVLRVRRRVYAGNLLVAAPSHDAGLAHRWVLLVRTVARRPSLVGPVLVFGATTLLAKVAARRAAGRGVVDWGRADAAPGAAVAPPVRQEWSSPVDAVVVTYRSADYVTACVVALDEALAPWSGSRIVVVDNASGDDVAEILAGTSPRLDLSLQQENLGFAAGCHVGADRSGAARLLFVNPDVVVEPDAVRELMRCADAYPRAGIVGGVAVTASGGRDERAFFGAPSLWSAVCFATGLSSVFPGNRWFDPESSLRWDGTPQEVGVVSGGMMLVERPAWDALGGFDPAFFLYGEDADLCLRARAGGWSPRVCPTARYRHDVGRSSSGANRLPLVLRGRVTTYRRNLPPLAGALAARLLVVGTAMRALAAPLRRPGGRAFIGSAAWRDAWRRRAEWREGWTSGGAEGARR
nr:glycosyltransferase [uncultured Actinotalea sp.]